MQDVAVLQGKLMNLKMETLDEVVHFLVKSDWSGDSKKLSLLAHQFVLAAIYRPYSSSLTAILLKQLIEQSKDVPQLQLLGQSIIQDVFTKMISRAYTPARSALSSFLFWCCKEHALSIQDIVKEAKTFSSSRTNFETVAFNVFVWLAPELQAECQEFFTTCEEIVNDMSQRQGLYPTVQRFLADLAKLAADDWAQLRQRRESSKSLRIFSAIFKRNEIEALLQLSTHPAFNIDQKIAQSIFEPALPVSNMPSMIEFAAYCGAIDCFEFLLMNGADVTATDNNGLRLRDFAIASGSPEIIEMCKEVDPEFDKANPVFAQFYYPGSDVSVPTLLASVASGNADMTFKCIESGVDINSTDHKGRTPLMIAAQYQHKEIVEYLLSRLNIDVNKQDVEGFTALQYACQNGSVCVLDLLLGVKDIDVMKAQRFGMTPWLWACQKGLTKIVTRLSSDSRVDLKSVDDESWNGAHFAAHHGHSEILAVLKEHHVDLNAQQKDGMAPLHLAASSPPCECLRMLLSWDEVDVMARDSDGLTGLHWAAQNGHAEAVSMFASCKRFDINAKDNAGWTALFWAAQDDHADVVEALLKCDALDVSITEKDGMIPLHLAAMNGELAVVKVLLSSEKVDVNAQDKIGNTPLHLACRNGNPDVVSAFIENPRVNVNIQQKDGMTPLHFAVSNGNTLAVQVMLTAPAVDVTLKDHDGCTAKDFATTFHLEEIEALFT